MTTNQTKQPIVFNGKTFYPRPGRGHQDQVPASPPAGAHGFYRSNCSRTHLYGLDGQLSALVLHNARQGHFVVTASIAQGKPRYMFSTCSLTERWLGLDELGYAAQNEMVRAFAKTVAGAGATH